MNINALPRLDISTNTTGCCPRFHPEGWENTRISFRDKPFLRAMTRSVLHVPLNMGAVFERVMAKINAAGAADPENLIVLSRELSPWSAEHLFAIHAPVDGEEVTALSGDFVTRVFEGPFSDARKWHTELREMSRAADKPDGRSYFYYTTCPKCAKAYGENYVVGFAEV
ncbi:hydrolase [Phaeovulum sp.]|uniref:hydrolase n=1 Tax=Phaeovulum sp. TaxID=2934796 RepID=UPI003565185F